MGKKLGPEGCFLKLFIRIIQGRRATDHSILNIDIGTIYIMINRRFNRCKLVLKLDVKKAYYDTLSWPYMKAWTHLGFFFGFVSCILWPVRFVWIRSMWMVLSWSKIDARWSFLDTRDKIVCPQLGPCGKSVPILNLHWYVLSFFQIITKPSLLLGKKVINCNELAPLEDLRYSRAGCASSHLSCIWWNI